MSITNEINQDTLTDQNLDDSLFEQLSDAAQLMTNARKEIAKKIIGQDQVIEHCLTTILAGGHGLLVGVPGLGKSLLVETMGQVLGLQEKRVQFTPDLMPADILGSEVLEEDDAGKRHFRFIEGPIFSQLLMADEINRASPRTQSALLQAMQEKRVSIAGDYKALPRPFHVLATQNPLEQEGTYPLPEAQLDRFLMEINIDYPDHESEKEIIITTTGQESKTIDTIMTSSQLMEMQNLIKLVPVGEQVVEAILQLVRSARPEQSDNKIVREHVAWGPGPRASQAFMQAIRARAILQQRHSPSIDDIIAIAHPILRHRMSLGFAAYGANITLGNLIDQLLEPLR